MEDKKGPDCHEEIQFLPHQKGAPETEIEILPEGKVLPTFVIEISKY